MASSSHPPYVLHLLATALLGLLVYSNTFHASFHFDDEQAILENRAIRDAGNLKVLWGAFNTRFVVGVTFALNYAFGKLDVLGYHLLNVLCHIFSSFLVYALVRLTFKTPSMKKNILENHRERIALFSSLIFLVHPLQTQGVTYIWQRAASLATFFYLASFVLYVKARLSSRKVASAGAFLAALLGMFTKETTFTLPFMLVFYEAAFFGDWKKDSRKRVFTLFPFLMTLGVIPLMLRRAPQAVSKVVRPPTGTLLSREAYLLTQLNVLRTYLRLLFVPVRQNLDYDYPIAQTLFEPQTLFSALLVGAIFFVMVKTFRKHRLIAFGMFWFFLSLSVESVTVLKDVIFEHRLYLPMVGFSIFLASALPLLLRTPKRTVAFSSAIVLSFSVLTYQRNAVWKDDLTLWRDTVKKSPNKARPWTNLGTAYDKKGQSDEAIRCYEKAIALDPHYSVVYYNLGVAYGRQGKYDEEIKYCQKAIALDPEYAKAYHNLGVAYGKKGDHEKEIACYQKAIALDPNDASIAKAYYNLGVSYESKGDLDKAIAYYEKALEGDPTSAVTYYNLSIAYGRKGEYDRVIAYCQKAIALDSRYAEAYNNLGFAYGKKGDRGQEIASYQKAIKLNPRYAVAYYNLGTTYGKMGDYEKAIGYFKKTIAFDPSNVNAHLNLGVACARKGDRDGVLREAAALKALDRSDLAGRLERLSRVEHQ